MAGERWEHLAGTRRHFLGCVAGAGIAGALGGVGAVAACAQTAPARPLRDGPLPDGAELIDRPLVLRDGDTLTDRLLVVSDRFESTRDDTIVKVAGNGVKIRNVRILGADAWQRRWNSPRREKRPAPGMTVHTSGIRVENVRDVSLERVAVEGMPQAGIGGFGIEGALFRELDLHHCFVGINFPSHAGTNRRIHVERVKAYDMWGPGPDEWVHNGRSAVSGVPSRKRPGGFTGGDGMALGTLRDSVIADSECTGEHFGSFKVVNPQGLEVRGLRGGGFQVQGTGGRGWKIHKSPARDIRIHDCHFDKGLKQGPGDMMNCMTLAWNIASVLIERCTLIASGQNGHGIQLTRNVHARIVGCTIQGFNGVRGGRPAHAIDVAHGSTVNDDFEQVNTFVDQKRIRLVRDPGWRPPPRR